MTTKPTAKCGMCGKRPALSEWEQQPLTSGRWVRLCRRCANRKLAKLDNHPLASAFIVMRRVPDEAAR